MDYGFWCRGSGEKGLFEPLTSTPLNPEPSTRNPKVPIKAVAKVWAEVDGRRGPWVALHEPEKDLETEVEALQP